MSERKPDRKGLGRGLSALMAEITAGGPSQGVEDPAVQARLIPVEALSPNPDQPRRTFSQDSLTELAASIRERGIIQPLIARPRPGHDGVFEIVAGERRWRAAQLAQLHQVPVLVRELSDTEVLEVAIIENIQRADLNPLEEAAGYRQLIERFGHTQEKVAAAMGKSRSHIANLLRLLNLPAEVQTYLREGRLTAGHARALLTASNPAELARRVLARGLSVRETEALMRKAAPSARRAAPRASGSKDSDTRILEQDLSASLGMSVTIDHHPGGEGKVVIRYNTLEQLDNICQALSFNT